MSSGQGEAVENDATSQSIDPENWVAQFGEAMYRYALKRLGDPSLAEEIVQESFLAGLKSRDSFRGQSSVSTWLFAILRRKVADHYRRPGQTDSSYEESIDARDDRATRGLPRWEDDPAAIFEDAEFWCTFDDCVSKLPDKLAEVHMLREINQHTPKEICKILGISPTNLSMRLHRARLALRDCLEQNWFNETS